MKWIEDLVDDIRTFTPLDDQDGPDIPVSSPVEVSDCNRASLTERFLRVRDNAKAILEIGVARNQHLSHTHCFLGNKRDDTIYVGIDLDDKSFLNNPSKNIHTIKGSSSDVDKNMEFCKSVGVTQFDFIFIDGWHSINQCLIDWEYSKWLSDDGIIGFHDTTAHPGPRRMMDAFNRNKWVVEGNVCTINDYGIGFVWKKK